MALGEVPVDEVIEAIPAGVLVLDANGRVKTANGKAKQLLGHQYDEVIGAAIESLAALRSAASRLALLDAIQEASSDALFSQDATGHILTWNRSAERILGYPEGEIVGRLAMDLFPDHLQAGAQALFETVAGGERVDHVETEIRRRDGMLVPISLSLSPITEPDGVVVGSVSIAQDITEKRLVQATLAEVEARLREGEALAHVGRWLWDVGTGAVQWSEELHRIHEVDPLDFGGTFDAFMSCIHLNDRERVRAKMEAAAASGRAFEEEYRVPVGDGQVRLVYARAEPIVGSAETVVGLRGIGQDVTRARRDA